jgi:hypothetical protein
VAQPRVGIVRKQRGQVLAFLALVLPMALLPVVVYAIDAAALGARAAALQSAAAQAAEVAAQQLDAAALRSGGVVVVDRAQAQLVAGEILRAEEPGANLDLAAVDGAGVTVTASEPVALPIPWLQKTVTLRARASARLVFGYESPSSRLPLPASTF